MEDHRTVGHAINVVSVIRSLERVGDHARNIAEQIIYMARGTDVRHLGSAPGIRLKAPGDDVPRQDEYED